MWNILVLMGGGLMLVSLVSVGLYQRRAGRDIQGLTPISRPLFLAGKAAMGILWLLALSKAWFDFHNAGFSDSWMDATGAVLFIVGCCLSAAAFLRLGRELRFGLPDGEWALKTRGLYSWFRHPMYVGFYLMSIGSCLFVFNPVTVICLLFTLAVHHRVVLAEERFMEQSLGQTWRDYADRVPRYGGLRSLCKVKSSHNSLG